MSNVIGLTDREMEVLRNILARASTILSGVPIPEEEGEVLRAVMEKVGVGKDGEGEEDASLLIGLLDLPDALFERFRDMVGEERAEVISRWVQAKIAPLSRWAVSCPYCGGRVVSVRRSSGGMAVVCYGCGASGPPAETVDGAIRRWNWRKWPPGLAGVEFPPEG